MASIVSPSFATWIAARNEPAPLSFVLVTVMVAACSVTAINSKASGQRERFIKCFNGRVVVFISTQQDHKNLALLSSTLAKALAVSAAVFYGEK